MLENYFPGQAEENAWQYRKTFTLSHSGFSEISLSMKGIAASRNIFVYIVKFPCLYSENSLSLDPHYYGENSKSKEGMLSNIDKYVQFNIFIYTVHNWNST